MNQVASQTAEIKTLKALSSSPTPTGRGTSLGSEVRRKGTQLNQVANYLQSKHSFHGVVQRLVQKEKEASQLKAELERLKAQNPSEGRDTVSCILLLHGVFSMM